MKILWICTLPLDIQREALAGEPHGAQVSAPWILAHLPPPPKVELHLACLWPGGRVHKIVEYQGAKIHLLPCPRRGRALLLFQNDVRYFRPLAEELRPEVIHAWGTEDSFGLVAQQLAPRRHVVGIQGLIGAYRKRTRMPLRTLLTAITEKWTLAKARCVVAESEYSLQEAAKLCRRKSLLRVIEQPLRREFLQSSSTPNQRRNVAFVGTIEQRKGISDAIEAFAKAAPPQRSLHVIGSGAPDNENEMHSRVERHGLGARFRHTRSCRTDELVSILQSSSVFLLPTQIDTGPTALKEALILGLWPVCYDNSGPAEYIRKYEVGSLAKDGSVSALAEELERVLRRPLQADARFIDLRERMRRDFSAETAWKNLISVYETLADSD